MPSSKIEKGEIERVSQDIELLLTSQEKQAKIQKEAAQLEAVQRKKTFELATQNLVLAEKTALTAKNFLLETESLDHRAQLALEVVLNRASRAESQQLSTLQSLKARTAEFHAKGLDRKVKKASDEEQSLTHDLRFAGMMKNKAGDARDSKVWTLMEGKYKDALKTITPVTDRALALQLQARQKLWVAQLRFRMYHNNKHKNDRSTERCHMEAELTHAAHDAARLASSAAQASLSVFRETVARALQEKLASEKRLAEYTAEEVLLLQN
jgi:hypothetical protein